ncbi:ABC transporter ATP-binding protein [Cohnella kolymensis]|uniref:ABC transporter ATP-binding protein n=1 Tax=Cohnella kolymensis TaxID=1590652 RepID=A0ABR5A6E5_9BACL|nr:ABC transporter ATP-binding protein [Cohnella kolymensis]KIL36609.1 ABC transporter ATP-binding protein [Cohnella kolymensis]
MLTVRNLSKSIEQLEVLKSIDFSLNEGQVAGVVGRNGAGKTTLFKTIAGIMVPDEGTVEFEGLSVHKFPQSKTNIVFVPDNPEALFGYTPFESAHLFSKVYPRFDRKYFLDTMKKLDLPMHRKVRQFSKGMRMMFGTALGLSTKAQVVLLDEPTNGIDPIAKKQVLKLLVEAAEEGTTLVISSHLLEELERIADTVLMMKDGRIDSHSITETTDGSIRKFQVVFQEEAPQSWLSSSNVHVLEHVGRVYTVLVDIEGKPGPLEELAQLNPMLMEPLPMKLEDLFVWKLGGRSRVG